MSSLGLVGWVAALSCSLVEQTGNLCYWDSLARADHDGLHLASFDESVGGGGGDSEDFPGLSYTHEECASEPLRQLLLSHFTVASCVGGVVRLQSDITQTEPRRRSGCQIPSCDITLPQVP